MGGGDLNSKKSWHPNTIKNQERVWKAEQAQAQEKKRISELQRERAEERDRTELNDLAKLHYGSGNDDRLHWMYNKPDKKIDNEEFLLGKSIDKRSEPSEQDVIPAVSRRVVGSSLLTAGGDGQVDLARKMREDPLLLVKERERAARAALLNNPVHRKKITELLRIEQDKKKESKSKKKRKDLDDMLAAKLNALGGNKGLDVAALLASDDSSSDSGSDSEKKKSKKKKKNKKSLKKKKKRKDYDSDKSSSEHEKISKKEGNSTSKKNNSQTEHRKILNIETKKRNDHSESDESVDRKKSRRDIENTRNETKEKMRGCRDNTSHKDMKRDYQHSDNRVTKSERFRPSERSRNRSRSKERDRRENRDRTSAEEREARLAEMAAAGAAREVARSRRVQLQRLAESDALRATPRAAPRPALPESLEARIHSNRHYIQRDRRHMDTNFAKR